VRAREARRGEQYGGYLGRAEVAVSGQMFADILSLIARLRSSPAPA